MSINFISTGVLTSEDGLDFQEKSKLESEEDKQLHLSTAQSKPLAQVLAERKQAKEDEYAETAKALRAPQAGLDDDDLEYILGMDKSRAYRENQIQKDDDIEIQNFQKRSKVMDDNDDTNGNKKCEKPKPSTMTTILVNGTKVTDSTAPIVVVRKRKREEIIQKNTSSSHKERVKTSTTTTTAALELLGNYFSSSDDDSCGNKK
jgi:hypothetical protein